MLHTLRSALTSLSGRSAEEREARRVLARELADVTAAGRTELTLLAAEARDGGEVVEILRGQAARRLLLAG